MATKLREVMTSDPVCLDASTTVADAARRMRDDGIGDVIVLEDGQMCGILTDRDIVVRAVADAGDLHAMHVGDICSRHLFALSPEDDVHEAVQTMEHQAVRRVPLVENGQPVGIVSIGDLAIVLDQRSALGQISAAPSNR